MDQTTCRISRFGGRRALLAAGAAVLAMATLLPALPAQAAVHHDLRSSVEETKDAQFLCELLAPQVMYLCPDKRPR